MLAFAPEMNRLKVTEKALVRDGKRLIRQDLKATQAAAEPPKEPEAVEVQCTGSYKSVLHGSLMKVRKCLFVHVHKQPESGTEIHSSIASPCEQCNIAVGCCSCCCFT